MRFKFGPNINRNAVICSGSPDPDLVVVVGSPTIAVMGRSTNEDSVMGKRHNIEGFEPWMDTRGLEKSLVYARKHQMLISKNHMLEQ